MENGPFIDGLPINSMVISMAMLNNQYNRNTEAFEHCSSFLSTFSNQSA
jgi:hypothetical protein